MHVGGNCGVSFQSTPSRRGRHRSGRADIWGIMFQSTPSRRGRRDRLPWDRLPHAVSIHALAKRATLPLLISQIEIPVSIHALAKRATSAPFAECIVPMFQSTPSRRGRRQCRHLLNRTTLVSIHALAKRATGSQHLVRERTRVSIHALAKRATGLPALSRSRSQFQSTPSRRGRRGIPHRVSLQGLRFNPRPREEGDVTASVDVKSIRRVSIHALAKRATMLWRAPKRLIAVSIHALAKRATLHCRQ